MLGAEEDDFGDRLDKLFCAERRSDRFSGTFTVRQQLSLLKVDSKRYMMDPHCKARVAHDILSIFTLVLDVACAPVVLAWDLKAEGALFVLDIFSLSFWSLDIVMSFITGYYVLGQLESRPRHVARRYCKSWLIPDFAIVTADIITLVANESGGSAKESGSAVFRLSKAVRFMRLARLCRLLRVSEAFARLVGAHVYLELTLETAKPLWAIILVNHVLACVWWAISSHMPSDTDLRWINEPMSATASMSYVDSTWAYQYTTCVHWSLTQLTPGSMQVAPLNSAERMFNCFGLLLGMVIFSTLISLLSSKMMQHYHKQKDKLTKLAALRRFLVHKVQPSIAIAAQFHANKAMSINSSKPITMKEVAAIAVLPQALQRDIQIELCAKHLQHPLFRWWFVMDLHSARAMCLNAIDFIGLAAEDHLFFPRAFAVGAYIMARGAAMYIVDVQGEGISHKLKLEVDQDSAILFCEAALWCKWKHVGELTASVGCELLAIAPTGLCKCLDQDAVVKHIVLQYGRNFHARLTGLLLPDGEQPNDLFVPFTEFDSILLSLPLKCRQFIGGAALYNARHSKGRGWKELADEMAFEVREGKCCIMLNWKGEVERIVSIIVLRLSRQDGRVLAQLGKWDGACAQASCELPGKKQMEGESPTQTLDRLLFGAFAPLRDAMTCTSAKQDVTRKESERMQVKTKYLRTLNHAELICPLECLELDALRVSWRSRKRTAAMAGSIFVEASSQDDIGIDIERMPTQVDDDIYALADESGQITLFSWLRSEDFAFFTSPGGDISLQGLLDNVFIEPEKVEAAKVRHAAAQWLEERLLET